MNDVEKKKILRVLSLMVLLNVTLVLYLSYFQIFQADKIKQSSYNKRLWANEDKVLRGSFYDRNKKVLVYSEKDEEEKINRIYKYDHLYSHIIGYSSREYGKAGLEKSYNSYLLDEGNFFDISGVKELLDKESIGNDIVLTIDHDMQLKTRELLLGKKGSIITMNPKTGEIYSMISMPDFNVNTLKDDWDKIIDDTNSPLLNRATQGLYPPGSTFKIITALSSLQNNIDNDDFTCTGSTTINGYTIRDYDSKSHGIVDMNEAFRVSCNTYFAEIAVKLGQSNILQTSEKFYFNKDFDFDLDIKKSSFPTNKMDKTELAASGIGQGKILATPLEMLMVASGIANDGNIVKPHLVSKVLTHDGILVKSNDIEILSNAGSHNDVEQIKNMMVEVVENGTGTQAKINGITVAGKTGTAENASGNNHAWFVGFAPAEDPKIAVVVLLEEEGSTGGSKAAPIAGELIKFGLNNIK
ncbi:penicillin-binding protein 2 [Soehngenia longivitae]|uniref:Penicillin-binding protein 2 n=1 Tax=Soehngenia longivitae TaxID=2562294 RepID=A0A4Z0D1U8_9FIRM|nr:penicillin-binding protein 2 [Soehngenia longivitae]TFZ39278.1 penicillin-binding protein 2 [Soehngenia longivitae]